MRPQPTRGRISGYRSKRRAAQHHPPAWTSPIGGPAQGAIPGGRDVAKDIVETYYDSKRGTDKFRGCSGYADFRELLDKEKDVNAVKIMTPDHLHGVISIAAMKKGKHVIMHKPIANRLQEAKRVIETARETGVATHFMPWDIQRIDGAGDGLDPGRLDRHAARGAQLDQPSRLAAVRRPSPPTRRPCPRASIGTSGWDRRRAPLSSELHPHGVPRLVRFRRRLHGGHGPLQPLDRLQRAGAWSRRPASIPC